MDSASIYGMRCAGERLVADVTILDLAGRGMLGEINTEVTDRVRALIGERRTKLLLNLGGVSYLDSNGLGDLAGAYQVVAKQGATMKLSNVQQRVFDLLRTVNLAKAFEIFDSEEEALRSFH
jgi:anti-sigma B factor antagonist